MRLKGKTCPRCGHAQLHTEQRKFTSDEGETVKYTRLVCKHKGCGAWSAYMDFKGELECVAIRLYYAWRNDYLDSEQLSKLYTKPKDHEKNKSSTTQNLESNS